MVTILDISEDNNLVNDFAKLSANGNVSPISHIYVEICLQKGVYKIDVEKQIDLILSHIRTSEIYNWKPLTKIDKEFESSISKILVGCMDVPDGNLLDLEGIKPEKLCIYFYSLKEFGGLPHEISTNDDESIGSYQWEIPCHEFDHLWENLFYNDNIKNELLAYVSAILRLSQCGANTNILSMNRLVLLYGPPGTGKTTLCKALAQRLSIHLNLTYKRSIFIEVNSHSLFSKWFSESGKLVMKMFNQIEELAEDPNSFVCVLIDEVEFNNVLVLTTSNITEALDEAFVDRTDMCRFIGYPTARAIYSIFNVSIVELQRINVINKNNNTEPFNDNPLENDLNSKYLWELAKLCEESEISGRTLRKLPISAYSKHFSDSPMTLPSFLNNLKEAINDELKCKIKKID